MRKAYVVFALILTGCSGEVQKAPDRDPKPVEGTVVIKVPNMT
jgi:hypothetical protein